MRCGGKTFSSLGRRAASTVASLLLLVESAASGTVVLPSRGAGPTLGFPRRTEAPAYQPSMDIASGNRREFLASSAALLGGAWATMQLPALATLAAWARTAGAQQAGFTTLTPEEARTLEAFAAQIVPSDAQLPGAREAGAIYFIDRSLGSHFAQLKEPIRQGIADLDARARRRVRTARTFADLDPANQVRVMRQVEEQPFFMMGRMLTVMGVFADPSYGGNRDDVGGRILGIEHQPSYQPPFGWYDAEEAKRR